MRRGNERASQNKSAESEIIHLVKILAETDCPTIKSCNGTCVNEDALLEMHQAIVNVFVEDIAKVILKRPSEVSNPTNAKYFIGEFPSFKTMHGRPWQFFYITTKQRSV